MLAARSLFASVPAAPPDPILGLTEAYQYDPSPRKVNLGVGVYLDESGKAPVLNSVRTAEIRLTETPQSRSYLPIDGLPEYTRATRELLLGAGHPLVSNGQAFTVQAPGGTGALRIGADFLRRFHPDAGVFISQPSWENHRALFEAAGFTVQTYPYYDPESRGLNFEAMAEALRQLPDGAIVVLHVCCHNPTGVDLSSSQWDNVVSIFRERPIVPFLDFAYQGFGQGIQEDAYAVRAFADAGIPFLVASSYSKSFSLYSERVGALTLFTADPDESKRCLSQVKRVIRSNYSNPPAHGARVVATILNDADLRREWVTELTAMRERIHALRRQFVSGLKQHGTAQDFSFIARQQGMFSYSGLTLAQVRRLREEFSIYIVDSGRICVAAMNSNNLPYICQGIGAVAP